MPFPKFTEHFDLDLVSDDSQDWDREALAEDGDEASVDGETVIGDGQSIVSLVSEHGTSPTIGSERATLSPDTTQTPPARPNYPPLVGRKGEYASVKKSPMEARQDFHEETMGFYVGTMPEQQWLDTAYPLDPGEVEEDPPPANFSGVLSAKNELEMYVPLVKAILASKSMPDNTEIIISANASSETSNLRPDMNMLRLPRNMKSRQAREPGKILKEPFDFRISACGIEIKSKAEYDGFIDDPTADSCENPNGDGVSTRGQLAMYAEEIFHQQHVTSVPQILICERWARFLKWDRSAVLVSQRFDYIENPQLLLKGIRRILTRSAEGRGRDPTVRYATPAETEKFIDAVTKYVRNLRYSGEKELQAAYVALDTSYRCCAVKAPDGQAPLGFREVIVGRPFWTSHSPIGRGTRGYIAYDLLSRRLVFMKDSWRVDHPHCLPEMDAYRTMQAAEPPVSGVLYPICGGDVGSWQGGKIQRTQNQHWADDTSPWRAPCQYLRTLVHTRIVQELAYPMTGLTNSQQAVKVFNDVLITIEQAHLAGILHQDVANHHIVWLPGAVPGVPDGYLIDWDHCRRLKPEGMTAEVAPSHIGSAADVATSEEAPVTSSLAASDGGGTSAIPSAGAQTTGDEDTVAKARSATAVPPLAFRSATWATLSVELLQDIHRKPELFHDLESLFWSTAYFASHFCDQHSAPDILMTGNGNPFNAGAGHLFQNSDVRRAAMVPRAEAIEWATLADVAYKCRPLKTLLEVLNARYSDYYLAAKIRDKPNGPKSAFYEQAIEHMKTLRAELSRCDWMRGAFEDALQADDWLSQDIVENQLGELSKEEVRQLLERRERARYDSSHRAGTDTALMRQAGGLQMVTEMQGKRKDPPVDAAENEARKKDKAASKVARNV